MPKPEARSAEMEKCRRKRTPNFRKRVNIRIFAAIKHKVPLRIMINRELIRLKVVQLVYSYYQNEGKAFDIAEKELDYSLNKAYELYEYLLTVLIELKRVAERKDAVRLAREKRTGVVVGGVSPDHQFACNQLLQQFADNKALMEFQEKRKGSWMEEDAFVKKLYTQCVESDIYQY